MKALVVYYSTKTGNTKKVANAIAKGMKKKYTAKAESLGNFKPEMIPKYDIIGFGSGIYMGGISRELRMEVRNLPKSKKKAFVFGTSGAGKAASLNKLKEMLKEKGFSVKSEFMCKGYDNWGPFKLMGGINKGRPNAEDLEKAEKFGASL